MLIVFFPDTFEKSAVYGLIIVIHLNYIHSALKKKKMYVVNIWCSSLVKTGTKCSEDVSRAKILSTQRRKKKKKRAPPPGHITVMAQGQEQSCQPAGTGAIRGSCPVPLVGLACRFFSEVWKSKTLVPLPPGSLQTDRQISISRKNLCGGHCFSPALPMVWEFLRDLEQLPLSKKLEV